MSMFADARKGANTRMAGMGMGEFDEDPPMPEDPAAELMGLIEQVPDPGLADALRAAAMKLTGGEPAEPEGEFALEDPVVAP